MIAELFMNNAFNLTVILSCCTALVLMSVWYHREERRCKGFIFHAAQFFVYAIIIGTFGSIANNVIESYSLKFISPSVVDFICTSLIALILTIKLFLVINQFEKTQINKGRYHQREDLVAYHQDYHRGCHHFTVWRTLRYELIRPVNLWRHRRYRCGYGGERYSEQLLLRHYALFRQTV